MTDREPLAERPLSPAPYEGDDGTSSPAPEVAPPTPTPPPSLYDDKSSRMTNGRRIARFLAPYGWYNPQVKEDDGIENMEKPSLDAAWEYFEHIVLPRCFAGKDIGNGIGEEDGLNEVKKQVEGKNLVRAEQGENRWPTKLYPILGTNDEDMSDFGIGVGLYFNTLKYLSIISLLAGLINIPNMIYFASDAYEGTNGLVKRSLDKMGLKG